MPKKFAVFDIDGTLIRWQLYHAVVDRLAKRELLGADAHQKLKAARMDWKRRIHPDAFKRYEQELIEVYESALPSLSIKDFDAAVADISTEYQEQVYTFTRDLIQELKQQSYIILAISGSHQEVVEKVAQLYGFDDVVGTSYKHANGRYTGDKFVASHDKQKVLQALIEKHRLILRGSVAVGDSGSDVPMLEMVERPIAFNPDKVLFDTARVRGWEIIVERKNVVYELKKSEDGRYLLA